MNQAEAKQTLDGVLLSDGGLRWPVRGLRPHFSQACSSSTISTEELLTYLKSIRHILETLGIEFSPLSPKAYSRRDSRPGKVFDLCCLWSLCSFSLREEYRRWYGFGQKEVPEDLILTPISLAYWFMGDGNSHRRRPVTINVSFATHGFSQHSVGILINKLGDLGLYVTKPYKVKRVKKGAGLVLYLRQESVDKFMDLVDPYVIEPYRYKIKRKDMTPCLSL